jgi:methyl-accepting chemotaxis protein
MIIIPIQFLFFRNCFNRILQHRQDRIDRLLRLDCYSLLADEFDVLSGIDRAVEFGRFTQFRTFGEGLQMLNDKVDQNIKENRREHQQIIERIDHLSVENRQEHQLFMQMVKELDTEVIKMKRVK